MSRKNVLNITRGVDLSHVDSPVNIEVKNTEAFAIRQSLGSNVLLSVDTINSILTFNGDMVITGNVTTVGSSVTTDNFVKYASNNTADTLDSGWYSKYIRASTTYYAGMARLAGTNNFMLFYDSTVEPTTVANSSNYGNLILNALKSTSLTNSSIVLTDTNNTLVTNTAFTYSTGVSSASFNIVTPGSGPTVNLQGNATGFAVKLNNTSILYVDNTLGQYDVYSSNSIISGNSFRFATIGNISVNSPTNIIALSFDINGYVNNPTRFNSNYLTVDNITIDLNTISSTSGSINITPLSGQNLVLSSFTTLNNITTTMTVSGTITNSTMSIAGGTISTSSGNLTLQPTANVNLPSLTASRLVYSDASKNLTSLSSGTATQLLHGDLTWGSVSLTADVSGILPANQGGTGQSTYTVGDILYANNTTTLTKLSAVAVGSVLISNGVNLAPSYSTSPTLTSLAIGGSYLATVPPTNGLIVQGNVSFGSSSTTSLFNVGSSNQFRIDTSGIVQAGTWQGSVIGSVYGGTGINNNGLTINLASGAVGKVLASDSSGNATWVAITSLETNITGTQNQVLANATFGSAQTGAVILTTPQDIGTASNVQFGKLGLGVATASNRSFITASTITASGASAIASLLYGTLSAAAISDVLTYNQIGLSASTVIATGTYTGLTVYLNYIAANNVTKTGTGSVTNIYGSYIDAITSIGTNQYGLYVKTPTGGGTTNIAIYGDNLSIGTSTPFNVSSSGVVSQGVWNGTAIGLTYGGTNNNAMVASNGGIVYSDASKLQILSGTATANKALFSGSSATPTWSGYAFPASVAAGALLYASSATVLSTISAVATGSMLISAGTSAAPVWSSIASNAVTTLTGSASQVLVNGGSGVATSGAISLTLPQSIATSSTVQFGKLGLGVTVGSNQTQVTAGTLTTSSGSAINVLNYGTLTASAINDVLTYSQIGLSTSTVISTVTYTGLTAYMSYIAGSLLTKTGTGSITNVYGLYVDSIATVGTNQYSIYAKAPTGGSVNVAIYGDNMLIGTATPFTVTSSGVVSQGVWNGTAVGLTYGGTNNSLTASNGGIVYSDASKLQILSGTATANLMMLSGSSAAPSWSGYSMPSSITAGALLYASSTTVVSTIPAVASGSVLVSAGTSAAPSWSALTSVAVTTLTGTSGQVLVNGTFGSATSGAITLTLPQSIATSSNVQFNQIGIGTSPTQALELGGTSANLYMNSGTSNLIRFNTSGTNPPAFTTRSVGTKILLYPQIDGTNVDYGLGIDVNTLWYSVPQNNTTFMHKWYGGTTVQMTLNSTGLGIGSTPSYALHARKDAASALGPTLFLENQGGSAGAACNIDAVTYAMGANAPGARIAFTDIGGYTDAINFLTKAIGFINNSLVSRMYIDSTGVCIGSTSATSLFNVGTSNSFRIDNTGTVLAGIWNGTAVSLTYGGTGGGNTASNGGMVYSDASQMRILAGTATARQTILSGASTAPTWSPYSLPATVATGDLLYASSATAISSITNPGTGYVLVSGSSVPAWATLTSTAVTSLQGTANQVLVNAGSGSTVTGPIILTTPQDINTNSNVQFGKLGLGAVVGSSRTQVIAGTLTASSNSSINVLNYCNFTASANNDVLTYDQIGVASATSVATVTYTGLTVYMNYIAGSTLTKTGTGTISNVYGSYIDAISTIGTNQYGLHVKAPTGGTTNTALYTDNLSVGFLATSPPTNGIISKGSLGVGTIVPVNPLSVSPIQYNSGVVTATQTGNTVTASSAVFTSNMVGSQFIYSTGVSAGTISGFTSTTIITVTVSQTVASATTFYIVYNGLQVDSTGEVGVGILNPVNMFSVSPYRYSTGTAQQTASTTVTGVGTTFTSAMIGSIIIYSTGVADYITGYTNATTITVNTSRTIGPLSFVIYYTGLQLSATTGYVGVGLTTPASPLDVAIQGSAGIGTQIAGFGSLTAQRIQLFDETTGSSLGPSINFNASNVGRITGGGKIAIVNTTSTDTIGLGTATPVTTAKVNVSSGLTYTAQFDNSTSGNAADAMISFQSANAIAGYKASSPLNSANSMVLSTSKAMEILTTASTNIVFGTNSVQRAIFDTNGYLGINIASPLFRIHTRGEGVTGDASSTQMIHAGSDRPWVDLIKGNGSLSAITAVALNNVLGSIQFGGYYSSSAYNRSAEIRAVANEAFSSATNAGTYVSIRTTPTGTATAAEVFRVGSSGGLILASGSNPSNLLDLPSGGTLTGAQIGFTAGTTAPTNGLAVSGYALFGLSSAINTDAIQAVSSITVAATSAPTTGVMRFASAASVNYIQSGLTGSAGSAAELRFTNVGGTSTWMRITNAGNVSIGSATTTSMFNVGSSAQFQVNSSGIVAAGTWQGSTITSTYGGTGANNSGRTINITTGSAGRVLASDGSGNAAYSTATYPLTTTVNQILYSSATNVIGGITTANNGVLITSAGGVPSISSTLPSAVQTGITSLGTITTGTWQGTAVGVTYGGTGSNLSGTGGTSRVLMQTSIGAAISVAQLAASDLSNGTTGSGQVVLATSPTLSTPTISGNLTVGGNLIITGGTYTTYGNDVLVGDRFISMNSLYTTNTPVEGGLIFNYSPTTTATTVNGVFTAGVAATSNPTVVTTGSATFAAGDIVLFVGSGIGNDGIYEVNSHVGTTLTIRGIGTVANTYSFTGNQFVSGSATGATTITKTSVSVIRCSTTGSFAVGVGSTASSISFKNFIIDNYGTNQLLYSNASSNVSGLTSSNYGVLISNATGVPSWLGAGITGQVLVSTTSNTPSWSMLSGIAVTSIAGTNNQINANVSVGAVTLSLSSTIVTPGTLAVTGSLTSGSSLTVTSSTFYNTVMTGVQTTVDGASTQYGLVLNQTLNPTSGSTTSFALYTGVALKAPLSQTIASGGGYYVNNNYASNVGTITTAYGIYVTAGTGPATGTITRSYGGYFTNQTAGNTKVALYADNLALGYTATAPPTNGAIISGNVSIGATDDVSALYVNGTIGTCGYITNSASRPSATTSRIQGEIASYGSNGTAPTPASDDGFLRLSAGGGTTYYEKTFIDISGYSTNADMFRTIMFNTGGVEKMRINNTGIGIGTRVPLTTLNVSPVFYQSIGTAVVASQTGYVVTATGGTPFASTFVGMQLVWSNGVYGGIIVSQSSTTVITVTISQTISSQAFTVNYIGTSVEASGDLLNGITYTPTTTTVASISPFATGAVSVSGTAATIQQSASTTVTGVNTNFTASMVGMYIMYNDGTIDVIKSVSSTTSITVSTSRTKGPLGFSVHYAGLGVNTSGQVSVGSLVGGSIMSVTAPIWSTNGYKSVINAYSMDTLATDMGGGLILGGQYITGGTPTEYAQIVGGKNNSTSGNFDGNMQFGVRQNGGSMVEAMRISPNLGVQIGYTVATPSASGLIVSGSVGIGVSSTSTPYKLDVQSTGINACIRARTTTTGSQNEGAVFICRGDQANGYAQTHYQTGTTDVWVTGLRTADANYHFYNGTSDTAILSTTGFGINTTPSYVLHARKDASGALGPTFFLENQGGAASAACNIDIATYAIGVQAPSARIAFVDAGNNSNTINFLSKIAGSNNNALTSRLYIDSSGNICVGNTSATGMFNVGSSNQFRVATTGNITVTTGTQYAVDIAMSNNGAFVNAIRAYFANLLTTQMAVGYEVGVSAGNNNSAFLGFSYNSSGSALNYGSLSLYGVNRIINYNGSRQISLGACSSWNSVQLSPSYADGGGLTASQSGYTVTASGAVFVAGMVGNAFVSYIDGTYGGVITGFTSTTVVSVARSQTVASQNFMVNYIGLQVDSSGRVGISTMEPINNFSVQPYQYSVGGGTAQQSASTTVTGVGTTFTSSMVGSLLVYNDGTVDTITGFSSTTSITVSTSRTIGPVGFTIRYAGLQVTSAGQVTVGSNLLSTTTPFAVFGSGSSTSMTQNLANFASNGGVSNPSLGNLYNIYIDKNGTEGFALGINKNTTTGTIPANSCFISSFFSGTAGIAIGRGNSAGLPSTADIFINSTGKVGVGNITSLTQAFEVAGAIKISTNPSVTSDNTNGYFWNQSGVGPTIGGNAIQFMTNGNNARMTIANGGTVGINTTQTTAQLNVATTTNGIRVGDDWSADSTAPALSIFGSAFVPILKIVKSGVMSGYITTSSSGLVFNTDTVNVIDFRTGASASSTAPNTQGTSRLYINSSGNVCVGGSTASGLFNVGSTAQFYVASTGNLRVTTSTDYGMIINMTNSTNFIHSYQTVSPNMTIGQVNTGYEVGLASSTYNTAYYGFNYRSSGSLLNYGTMGMFAADRIVNFNANYQFAVGSCAMWNSVQLTPVVANPAAFTASQTGYTVTANSAIFAAGHVGNCIITYADGTFGGVITGFTSTTVVSVARSQTVSSQFFMLSYIGLQIDSTGRVGVSSMEPTNNFSVQPYQYSAGGATAQQTASTTVVGVGTAFTAAMVGSLLVYNDGTFDVINGFTSATSVTVGTSRTIGPLGFTIRYTGLQVNSTGNVIAGANIYGALTAPVSFTAGATPEAYALSSSSRYAFYTAGTMMAVGTTSGSVVGGALIDFTAYNSNNATNIFLGAVAGSGGSGTAAHFVIGRRTGTTSWSESLRVNSSGQLGIGTNNPSQALEFGGTSAQIYMNSATSNSIIFNTNGVAAPTTVTRSAGTKIVLYPEVGASTSDYALGIEGGTMWQSVPSTGSLFKWYGATTEFMRLTNTGLGIGGISPGFRLEVNGSTATTFLFGRNTAQNANDTLYLGSSTANVNFFLDRANTGSGIIMGWNTPRNTTQSGMLQVYNNSTNRVLTFAVYSQGSSSGTNAVFCGANIGQGVSGPLYPIHVYNATSTAMLLRYPTSGADDGQTTGIRFSIADTGVASTTDTYAKAGIFFDKWLAAGSGRGRLYICYNDSATSTNASKADSRITLYQTQVGIGIDTPINSLSMCPRLYQSAGTAVVASQTGYVVTATGGTPFTAAMVGCQLSWSNALYGGIIVSYSSTTVVTVSISQTISSQAFSISYQGAQIDTIGDFMCGSTYTPSTSVLSAAPFNTGAVNVAGTAATIQQTASTTVVGVNTNFTSAMIGMFIIYSDGVIDIITAYSSATSITVGTSRTKGPLGFTLHYPGLQVTNTGRVGVGTSTPAQAFVVSGNSGSNNAITSEVYPSLANIRMLRNASNAEIKTSDNTAIYFQDGTTGPVYFTGGNVSVGSSSATSRFNVGTSNQFQVTSAGAVTTTSTVAIGGTLSSGTVLTAIGAGSSSTMINTAYFGSGGSVTAGNIYSIIVDKSGSDYISLGINKNTSSGSVPANGAFISTYSSASTISIGRGGSTGLPSNTDIFIGSTGNVSVGSSSATSQFNVGSSNQFQVTSAGLTGIGTTPVSGNLLTIGGTISTNVANPNGLYVNNTFSTTNSPTYTIGVQSIPTHIAASLQTISNACALYTWNTVNTNVGTITNAIGLLVDPGSSGAGTITNSYGAYIRTPSHGTSRVALFAENLLLGYATTVTSAGTLTLTNTSYTQQYFTGTTTHTVVLPVVSTLYLGYQYWINNRSTGSVTVQSSGGIGLLTLPAGYSACFTCILTSGTGSASWDVLVEGSIATSSAVSSITGTASQINASAATGAVTLSLSSTLVTPGTVAINGALQSGSSLTINSTSQYNTYLQGTMTAVDAGPNQWGLNIGVIMQPTNGSTNSFGQQISPSLVALSTKTISNAGGLYVNNTYSSNVGTLTNAYGVYIASGSAGAGTITNAYSIYVVPPTAAANNYAAYFGGSVGIGTVTPRRTLDVLNATNPQARLTYTDNSVYTDLQTNSSGHLLVQPSGGSIVPGTAALATNATQGFVYEETCAGQPTGVPTTYTGRAAKVFDTTNNVQWVYNGGWLAGNGQVLISKQVLGGATATVTFSSIPQVFNHLRVVVRVRSSNAANNDDLRLRLNTDSGANYDYQYVYSTGATMAATLNTAQTNYECCPIAAANTTGSACSQCVIDIIGYTDTTFYKTVTSVGGVSAVLGTSYIMNVHGQWRNTAAVTGITLLNASGGNFVTGCAFYLYGVY